jgi:tRNA (cmo5U34)-methyltransferase
MTVADFSFAEHADFDAHIAASIPGYDQLGWWCEKLSRRFVQDGTRVVDVGCSTGSLLSRVRDGNRLSGRHAEFIGIDVDGSFEQHWRSLRALVRLRR